MISSEQRSVRIIEGTIFVYYYHIEFLKSPFTLLLLSFFFSKIKETMMYFENPNR